MEQSVTQVIESCAAASLEGSRNFGESVGDLLRAGVESYHADFRSETTVWYLPDAAPVNTALPAPAQAIANGFDAGLLLTAIRGSQRGELKYRQFLVHARAAGCVGYIVWLSGRHVTYFGRRGEQHIERFPD